MKAGLWLTAAATVTLAGVAQAQDSGVAGDWRSDDGRAVIRIAPCGANATTMCGRIQRFLVPEPAGGARDTKNPDASLRSRPILGITIFSGLTRSGNTWRGAGYSPEAGRHFNATLTPTAERLTVRGCVAIFCQTRVMTRMR